MPLTDILSTELSAHIIRLMMCALFFFALGNLLLIWKRSRWPSVRGEILPSVLEASEIGGQEARRAMQLRLKFASYATGIRYQYEVNGVTYGGCRLFSAPFQLLQFRYQSTLNELRLATEIQVHYDPQNPNKAFLRHANYRLAAGLLVIASIGFFYATHTSAFWSHLAALKSLLTAS